MPSLRSRLTRSIFVQGHLKKVFDFQKTTLEEVRRKSAGLSKFVRLPRGTSVERVTVADLPAEWVRAANVTAVNEAAILYFDASKVEKLPLTPLQQDLSELPPMLIQVGHHEILLSDSTRLAEKAKQAGVEVTLQIWDHMWHVFHTFAAVVPEAKRAVGGIGEFVGKYTG